MSTQARINAAVTAIAEMADEEGAQALSLSSEVTKAFAVHQYMAAIDHDYEIVFTGHEYREALKFGQTRDGFIDCLLYAMTEEKIGEAVDAEIANRNRQAWKDRAVDQAIDDLLLRRGVA